jgi:hypothetical protein
VLKKAGSSQKLLLQMIHEEHKIFGEKGKGKREKGKGKTKQADRLQTRVLSGMRALKDSQLQMKSFKWSLEGLIKEETQGFSCKSPYFSSSLYAKNLSRITNSQCFKDQCKKEFPPVIEQKAEFVRDKVFLTRPSVSGVAAVDGAAAFSAVRGSQDTMIMTLPKQQGYSSASGVALGNCFREKGLCANVPLLIDEIEGAQMTALFEGGQLKACVWWHFSDPMNGENITIDWIEQGSRAESRQREGADVAMKKRFELLLLYFQSCFSGSISILSALEYTNHGYACYQPTHQYPKNLSQEELNVYRKITQAWTKDIVELCEKSGGEDGVYPASMVQQRVSENVSGYVSNELSVAINSWDCEGQNPLPAYMMGYIERNRQEYRVPSMPLQKFCASLVVPPDLNSDFFTTREDDEQTWLAREVKAIDCELASYIGSKVVDVFVFTVKRLPSQNHLSLVPYKSSSAFRIEPSLRIRKDLVRPKLFDMACAHYNEMRRSSKTTVINQQALIYLKEEFMANLRLMNLDLPERETDELFMIYLKYLHRLITNASPLNRVDVTLPGAVPQLMGAHPIVSEKRFKSQGTQTEPQRFIAPVSCSEDDFRQRIARNPYI